MILKMIMFISDSLFLLYIVTFLVIIITIYKCIKAKKIETKTTQTCVIERLLFTPDSRTLRNRFSKINLIITYFFGGLQKNNVYLQVE